MKLIVAGASHGVPEKHRFCTALFLCVGKNTYIIDAGAPISGLLDHYELPHSTVKAVFITHEHSDHLNGLPAFCSELLWWDGYADCDPMFFFPAEVCIEAVEHWCNTLVKKPRRPSLRSTVYSEGILYRDEVITVTARQNRHTAHSFSFVIEAEGKKLLFTGDLSYGFGEYEDIVGTDTYDLILCEGAHHDPGSVNERLKNSPTKRLILHHINLEREPKLAELAASTLFPCELAEDGLTVEL